MKNEAASQKIQFLLLILRTIVLIFKEMMRLHFWAILKPEMNHSIYFYSCQPVPDRASVGPRNQPAQGACFNII